MGKCVIKECFNCKANTSFYVNKFNYSCTKCGNTFPHAPIDEKKTTGYDYKMKKKMQNNCKN